MSCKHRMLGTRIKPGTWKSPGDAAAVRAMCAAVIAVVERPDNIVLVHEEISPLDAFFSKQLFPSSVTLPSPSSRLSYLLCFYLWIIFHLQPPNWKPPLTPHPHPLLWLVHILTPRITMGLLSSCNPNSGPWISNCHLEFSIEIHFKRLEVWVNFAEISHSSHQLEKNIHNILVIVYIYLRV